MHRSCVTLGKIILWPLALIWTTFWAIVLVVLLPIGVILALGFHVQRYFTSKAAIFLRPDLEKIVTMRGQHIAMGRLYDPLYNCMVGTMTCEGVLPIKEIKKIWKDKILKVKLDNGELRFPELQQYVTKWMEYLFWKPENSFSLDDHITEYVNNSTFEGTINKSFEPETQSKLETAKIGNNAEFSTQRYVDHKQLTQIRSNLTRKRFPKHRSPWEIIIVNNYKPNFAEEGKTYSAYIFRNHHVLGDAFALMKLVFESLGTNVNKLKLTKPNYTRLSKWSLLWKSIKFVYQYTFLVVYDYKIIFDVHGFHLPIGKVTQKFYTTFLDPTSFSTFREIAKAHDVSVTSVIHAAITAGIRKMMLKKKLTVPKNIRAAVSLPLPGHPLKLRNYSTCTQLYYPVGIENPVERLKQINTNYLVIKTDPLPILTNLSALLMGGLPYSLMKLVSMKITTMFVLNFPGPLEGIHNPFGNPIVAMDATYSPPYGCYGAVGVAVTYNDQINLSFAVERVLLSNESEINEMQKFVMDELQLLKSAGV